jgi:hypothetical protein
MAHPVDHSLGPQPDEFVAAMIPACPAPCAPKDETVQPAELRRWHALGVRSLRFPE